MLDSPMVCSWGGEAWSTPPGTTKVKPAESLGEATDYGIGLPKVRKIVLNCDSFSHPHVHSVTGTGEVCDEEAARRQFLKQALEPAIAAESRPAINPVRVGRYRPLRALSVIALANVVFVWTIAYLPVLPWWIGSGTTFVVEVASAELVWEDAKSIDKLFGEKVIPAGLWSLLAFFFSFIVVPIYTFDRRRNAIRQGK